MYKCGDIMKKGFTLMELIVVMAIIGFLLTVSIPIALNAVKRTRATQIGRNIRNLINAGETYYYTEKPENFTEISINLLENKSYLDSSLKEEDLSKYSISSTEFENYFVLESVYFGEDISTELVHEKYPFIQSTGNILFIRLKLGKW